MSEKGDPEVYCFQSSDAFLARSRGLPDDSSAKINEIRSTVHDDGCRRPGALRVRRGSSRAQENDLGLGGCCALRQRDSMPHEKKQNSESDRILFLPFCTHRVSPVACDGPVKRMS